MKFPVTMMWKAYYILKNKGRPAFLYYCDDVDMPDVVKERIEGKYKFENDPEFRNKIKSMRQKIENKMAGSDLSIDEIPF